VTINVQDYISLIYKAFTYYSKLRIVRVEPAGSFAVYFKDGACKVIGVVYTLLFPLIAKNSRARRAVRVNQVGL